MADASVVVVIQGQDNASGAINSVKASLQGLNGESGKSVAAMNGVSQGMTQTGAVSFRTAEQVRSYTAGLANTSKNYKVLQNDLQRQKQITAEYKTAVSQAAKQCEIQNSKLASLGIAQTKNNAGIKETIANYKAQKANAEELIKSNNRIIESYKWQERNVPDWSKNAENVQYAAKRTADLNAENKVLQGRIDRLNKGIAEHEQKIDKTTAAYKKQAEACRAAAATQQEAQRNLKNSQAAERAYSDAIQQRSGVRGALGRAFTTENGQAIQDIGKSIDTLTQPLQKVSMGFIAAGAASAATAISFEDNFSAVKKTVEGTPEQIAAIRQGLLDLGTVGRNGQLAIPVDTAQLTELAATGGRLGIATDNIVDFTEVMAQMSAATNLAGADGAATIARLMNVTNTSQTDVKKLGSAVVDLGANFATSENEIATLAMRMGATGSLVGISIQDILGYSTALSSMGIEAEAGGSAVSRIWMAIQSAVSAGGDDLAKFAKASGTTSQDFKKQWETDASGAFLNFLKGVSSGSDQIGTLTELGFSNIRDLQSLLNLTSAKGIELVTEALQRSNQAWAENTALQRVADEKGSTLASQLVVTKNNVLLAAQSFGETFMPAIAKASDKVKSYAQGVANMDDKQKAAWVSTAKGVVAAGLITKGVSAATVGLGQTVWAVGKLRSAFGVLAGAAPGVVGALGPVALGVAAVGTAAVVGYKAYKNYRYEQEHWADSAAKAAEKVSASYKKVESLRAVQREIWDLKTVAQNPESTPEQLNAAKARINEIAELLSKEYNLVINVESDGLDDAVEKVSQAADAASENEKAKLRLNQANLKKELSGSAENERKYADTLKESTQRQIEATNAAAKYTNGLANIETALNKWKAADMTAKPGEEKAAALKEYYQNIRDALSEVYGADKINNLKDDELFGAKQGIAKLKKDSKQAKKEIEDLGSSINTLNEEHEKFVKARDEFTQGGITQAMNGDVQSGIDDMTYSINELGASLADVAGKWSEAKNGVTFDFAVDKGGDTLSNYVNDLMNNMEMLGSASQYAAAQGALAMNGFSNMEQAAQGGSQALEAVAMDFAKLGQQRGVGIDVINQLAHQLGMLPDSKHIEISAEGNFSVIDDAAKAAENLNKTGKVKLKVNAEGNYDVIDTTDKKLKELAKKGAVTVRIDVENGTRDILDKEGNSIGTLNVDGTVTWHSDSSEPDSYQPGDKNGTAKYGVDASAVEGYTPPTKHGTVVYGVIIEGLGNIPSSVSGGSVKWNVTQKAKGTSNFEGGLAMVNDQTGIRDNRELVVDRGRAFIPQGENVILPLSRGAKVYTAAQTKRMMSAMGIPHFASGKDNSDGFNAARDDWSHYTKTHAVTTLQEFEKWNKLLKEEAENAKDTADAEEELFSIRQKLNEEAAKASEAYIVNRSFNNDWEDYGDTPLAAFARFKEQQNDAAAAAQITWEEADENIKNFGSKMYDERQSQSLNWVKHQKDYCGMTVDDEIEAYKRIAAYTLEYYEKGLIDRETFRKQAQEIDEKYLDAWKSKNEEVYSAWQKDRDNYLTMRSTYDDWDEVGDSESAMWARAMVREEEFLQAGVVSWQDAQDAKFDYAMKLYEAASNEYDKILEKQSDKISKLRDKYSKQEQDLQASWTTEDRATDLSEVNRLLRIYDDAVTDTGKQKYKDLLEQKKQLEREQKLEDLQTKHNEELERLQSEYDEMEQNKKQALKSLKIDTGGIMDTAGTISSDVTDVKELADTLSVNFSTAAVSTVNTLSDILDVIQKIAANRSAGSNYNDNRRISIAGGMNAYDVKKIVGNTIISGLIDVC